MVQIEIIKFHYGNILNLIKKIILIVIIKI